MDPLPILADLIVAPSVSIQSLRLMKTYFDFVGDDFLHPRRIEIDVHGMLDGHEAWPVGKEGPQAGRYTTLRQGTGQAVGGGGDSEKSETSAPDGDSGAHPGDVGGYQ